MTAGPTLLIILDGFGHAEPGPDNAISLAHTPTWDRLWAEAPHRLIDGSGSPWGSRTGKWVIRGGPHESGRGPGDLPGAHAN